MVRIKRHCHRLLYTIHAIDNDNDLMKLRRDSTNILGSLGCVYSCPEMLPKEVFGTNGCKQNYSQLGVWGGTPLSQRLKSL